jgi:uncharacterized protein (TIGR02680 family)
VAKKWIINRIGLINFWYYDEEEFPFSGGRLLLRGANGSGKSVTMQSFIPLLLDGNKSPERLDPFGSRARKIENYLLGEDESGENERTGYLYMEFIRQDSDEYLTLGMGLHARRGRPLDFWGFALTDGRRIGQDFYLYKQMGEKIPLTKQELKNRIGEGGMLYERQKDYMAMVNRLLFGFEQIEDYDELIKLLIQIRTPKLSKDFKPTVIYEILTNSLQSLSDEDLRPMSEAIENMDSIKSRLEQLQESKKAADRIGREFDKYNTFLLWEKARDFLQSHQEVVKGKEEETRLETEISVFETMRQEAEEELQRLTAEHEAVQLKHRELMAHDSYRIKGEIEERRKNRAEWEEEKRQKESALEQKRERERKLETESSVMKTELSQLEIKTSAILQEMSSLAKELYFDEHFFMEEDLRKGVYADYDWSLLKKEFQRYRDRIREVSRKLRVEAEENKRYDLAYGELEAAKRVRDDARVNVEQAERLLFEIKEEFIERIYSWRQQNQILKPDEEKMTQLQRLAARYPENSYDDLLLPVRQSREILEKRFLTTISTLDSERKVRKQQLSEKEEELREWLAMKEPEPPRAEPVARNRKRLSAQGIPFIPFYQAVDFKEEVPEELRGKIEEALESMSVLDALIIPEVYQDKLWEMDAQSADSYLFPKSQLSSIDLSSWLEPVAGIEGAISPEIVNMVIRSVITDDSDALFYLNEEGRYGIGGVLQGQVSAEYTSKFIGMEFRRRYREQVISALREEISNEQQEVSRIEVEIKEWEAEHRLLESEFRAFPNKDDLETAAASLHDAQLTLENRKKIVEDRAELVDGYYRQLQKTRGEVRNLASGLEIPVNLPSFMIAEDNLVEYADDLRELETVHSRLLTRSSHLLSLEGQLADLTSDLDDLRYDLGRSRCLIEKEIQLIAGLEETLLQMDYKTIEEQVDDCLRQINEIPARRDRVVARIEEGKIRAEETANRLRKLKGELYFRQFIEEIKREGFAAEYDLGYTKREVVEDSDLFTRAKEVSRQFKDWSKTTKSREEHLSSLQQTYFEVRPQLAEYNLDLNYIFNTDPLMSITQEIGVKTRLAPTARLSEVGEREEAGGRELSAEEKDGIFKARSSLRRLDIKARIQGKDVSFYTLADFLADSIAENGKLLRERDRQLFEDILANTISKKIRARIYHSEQWVEKMNRLMTAMNTSSGLTFNLAWKSRAAETEEQMDSMELVSLLKSDANLLRPEDFQRLASHFRSKIDEARSALEEAGVTKTFHTLIREVLDYRQWFEFQLFYTKTGERKREMTNNAFDRFSGGEKAMAMYVPLFSAVYAKYEGARADAPRLLSLDEAFAGVDENNIRDMFRLLEELDLNFIINSQSLWGDYDTVPDLAICELVRPNNANFVSVIRYRWNGKVRELITKEAAGWQ